MPLWKQCLGTACRQRGAWSLSCWMVLSIETALPTAYPGSRIVVRLRRSQTVQRTGQFWSRAGALKQMQRNVCNPGGGCHTAEMSRLKFHGDGAIRRVPALPKSDIPFTYQRTTAPLEKRTVVRQPTLCGKICFQFGAPVRVMVGTANRRNKQFLPAF